MAVKRYNGTSWDTVAGLGAQGAAAQSSSITTWVKTATGGETSLTGSSDSSTTLAYTPPAPKPPRVGLTLRCP